MEKNSKKTPKKTSTKKEVKNTDTQVEVKKELTISEVFKQYIVDKTQFRIYFRTDLIFDSKNRLRKDYPIFNENDFIIDDKKYIYKGIRIETY